MSNPVVVLTDQVFPGLVTLHVAYYSEASLRESQRKAATQVVKRLTGRPLDYPVAAGGEVRQADR
jgi:hypothetical protein